METERKKLEADADSLQSGDRHIEETGGRSIDTKDRNLLMTSTLNSEV